MIQFLEDYFVWHYSRGLKDIFYHIRTFFWFNNHLFSYSFLLKNLFSPFMRIKEKKLDIFSLESVFSFLVINGLMRIIGFISRLILLVVGILLFIFTGILSLGVLFVWITFPVFIVALLLDSLLLIFM